MAYEQMAQVYDAFMSDAPYDELLKFTCEIIEQYGNDVKKIADLGCGTGTMAVYLSKQGFAVQAVDYSADMLTAAQQHSANAGQHIQFIHQDLRELEGLQELDAAVSYFDVINYITEPDELRQTFGRIAASLKEDGIFLFDVHSLYSFEHNYAGETFSVIEDDLSYIWFCEAGEEPGEVFHDLTFFVRKGELYERFDEYHHQRTFPVSFYGTLLKEAGFNKIISFGGTDLNNENYNKKTPKIFILACK